MDAWLVLEAAFLQGAGSDDTLADGGAGFARGFAGHLPMASVGCASANLKRVWHCARLAQQLVEVHWLHLNLQVDAVQQRPRNLAHVVGALVLVAYAFLLGMPIVTARARIHRRHEHKRRGILRTVFRPRNRYDPVLQRLPHHLQNGAIEFRQLI